MRWPKKAPKWLIDLWCYEISYVPFLIPSDAYDEASNIKIDDAEK